MIDLSYHRRAQRHAVEVPCSIIGSSWDEPVGFHTTSLSAHGMFVPTSFPLSEGQHVVVSFRPPPSNRGPKAWRNPALTVFARVVRTVAVRKASSVRATLEGKPGMGLQFTDLTRPERRALQRCLRSLPEASSPDGATSRGAPAAYMLRRGRW
ncbi:MAG: PilZ domain-containing protein [Deltaproteobacteria bacterium]|jgi:hypothetical protein|nr:PilZ domain-containing protein [Deltaproteobacteria bacterium]